MSEHPKANKKKKRGYFEAPTVVCQIIAFNPSIGGDEYASQRFLAEYVLGYQVGCPGNQIASLINEAHRSTSLVMTAPSCLLPERPCLLNTAAGRVLHEREPCGTEAACLVSRKFRLMSCVLRLTVTTVGVPRLRAIS